MPSKPKPLESPDRDWGEARDLALRLATNLPAMLARFRHDADRTVEVASMGCRGLLGLDPADLIDSRLVAFASLIHPDDAARVHAEIEEGVREGRPFRVGYRLKRVDGTFAAVDEVGCAIVGSQGTVSGVESLVVPAPAHPEFALEVERLGRAARQAAHDLNNVLATIRTTAELVSLEAGSERVAADMAEIMAAADRGAALARTLGKLRAGGA
jgi:hypothetical protein